MRFGPFEFDAETLDLRRGGTPVHLQHQPKRVLGILVRNADRTVTREELRKEVWGDTFVDFDRGLNYCIAQIRSALGDDATRSVYVQTVAREGYRFIAPISPHPAFGHLLPASGEKDLEFKGRAKRSETDLDVPRPAKRGEGGRRPGEGPRWLPRAAGIAFVLVAIAIVATYAVNATHAKEDVPIVAVTRFDNYGDALLSRFADELSDDFVERLTTLSGGQYAVIGNAQILRRARDQRDLKAIASTLHAKYVILGQVFGSEKDPTILVHLIRMPDQTHLTVSRLDRPRMDPLAIAQKVATKFSRRLIDARNSLKQQ